MDDLIIFISNIQDWTENLRNVQRTLHRNPMGPGERWRNPSIEPGRAPLGSTLSTTLGTTPRLFGRSRMTHVLPVHTHSMYCVLCDTLKGNKCVAFYLQCTVKIVKECYSGTWFTFSLAPDLVSSVNVGLHKLRWGPVLWPGRRPKHTNRQTCDVGRSPSNPVTPPPTTLHTTWITKTVGTNKDHRRVIFTFISPVPSSPLPFPHVLTMSIVFMFYSGTSQFRAKPCQVSNEERQIQAAIFGWRYGHLSSIFSENNHLSRFKISTNTRVLGNLSRYYLNIRVSTIL